MNLTFSITRSFEKEFTTSNLVNSDLVIERISIFTNKMNLGYCLMLDTINNMQEGVVTDNSAGRKTSKQSPMVCINETYQTDHFNRVETIGFNPAVPQGLLIPKTRKWRFYMTDKEGHYITLKVPMYVSIHFSIKSKDRELRRSSQFIA